MRDLDRLQLFGAEALDLASLLGLVGVPQEGALKIVKELGGAEQVARATFAQLREIGLTEKQAGGLLAAFELGRRGVPRPLNNGTPVTTPHAALPWFQAGLQGLDHEEVHLLLLDRRLRPLRYLCHSAGSAAYTVVDVPGILKAALTNGATALMIAHNHPSGDRTPSPEDLTLTRRLESGCQAVGVKLLDHLILAGGSFSSLRELGHIANW